MKPDRLIFNNTVLKLQVTIITTTITAAALQDRNSGCIDFTRYNSKQTMIGSGTQPLGFALRKILLKIDFSVDGNTKLQWFMLIIKSAAILSVVRDCCIFKTF